MIDIQNIEKKELESLIAKVSGIWLVDINKTPYHLGFSTHGKFFSLRFKKKDFALDASEYLNLLEKKGIQILFIPMMMNYSLEKVKSVFTSYKGCLQNDCSCIEPILKVTELEGHNWILFDLLSALEQAGQLNSALGYNLPNGFQLTEYTIDSVKQNLLTAI